MQPSQPTIFHYEIIDSTNDEALRILKNNKPPFFVTSARQTAGRGRMGRHWHSPEGNLYFTGVFAATLPITHLPVFTLYAALKICHLLNKTTKAPLWLKWPNDLWIGKQKCAGFLAESHVCKEYGRLLLLGMGLNVNTKEFPGDLAKTATSLKQFTKKEWPLEKLTRLIADEILIAFERFSEDRYEKEMFLLWQRYDKLMGRAIQFEESGGIYEGRVLGLSPDGALCVKVNNKVFRLNSGEVTLSKFLR